MLDQDRTECGADEGAGDREGRAARLDHALAHEVNRRASAAEDRLRLVGGQAFDRAQTGPEQGRDGDESAAAGDGIDKAREQREAEQDQGDLGGIHSGLRPRRSG